jgi:hypothetical protein
VAIGALRHRQCPSSKKAVRKPTLDSSITGAMNASPVSTRIGG